MDNRDMMVKAAWLYHVEGLTQAHIAERMNLTRRRVNELLAMALDQGIVRISFASPLAESVELESKLCSVFGLEEAAVVMTPADPGQLQTVIGRATAAFLDRLIQVRKPASLGVGWGTTLRETVEHMTPVNAPDIKVRSMMGGLTRGSEINTFEIVRRFAKVLGAECHYLAAPIYVDSAGSRDIIMAQPAFRDLLQEAANVEASCLSVGDLTKESLQVRYGLPSKQVIEELRAAGAVGDIIGHYLDGRGNPVDHGMNERVIALDLEEYRQIPCRIITSGGVHKYNSLRAALSAGLATVLVTDTESARWLLENPAPPPA
ncbi:sugar-binding transcriptional regulator [Rhizobium sp. RM]|uniref:sugar-binding transcriptional regulator n=1 Tax=Rhizobium sp. RM TaxID=2748079 RepID=UPI00110DB49E|nr:sugar-binding transcriptional regulator [Rhizobium sp. RM]NWJ27138.1 sugar-binding transcriptional regulator [Rhizobium sp. RM]TMV20203.1 sugar-binding transcriptional regulator [Rhizobium sp. Td3]